MDGAFCKIGSLSCSVDVRKFDNKVDAVLKRHFATRPFIDKSRFAALKKLPAHDSDDDIRPGFFSCLLGMVKMSVMKWIVFNNNTCSFHLALPFGKLNLQYTDVLKPLTRFYLDIFFCALYNQLCCLRGDTYENGDSTASKVSQRRNAN